MATISKANLIGKRTRYFGNAVSLPTLQAALVGLPDPADLAAARAAYNTAQSNPVAQPPVGGAPASGVLDLLEEDTGDGWRGQGLIVKDQLTVLNWISIVDNLDPNGVVGYADLSPNYVQFVSGDGHAVNVRADRILLNAPDGASAEMTAAGDRILGGSVGLQLYGGYRGEPTTNVSHMFHVYGHLNEDDKAELRVRFGNATPIVLATQA